jgi:hypothetical protein
MEMSRPDDEVAELVAERLAVCCTGPGRPLNRVKPDEAVGQVRLGNDAGVLGCMGAVDVPRRMGETARRHLLPPSGRDPQRLGGVLGDDWVWERCAVVGIRLSG